MTVLEKGWGACMTGWVLRCVDALQWKAAECLCSPHPTMRTLCCQDTYSKHWIKSLDQHRIYTRLSPACRRTSTVNRACGAPVAGPWPSAESLTFWRCMTRTPDWFRLQGAASGTRSAMALPVSIVMTLPWSPYHVPRPPPVAAAVDSCPWLELACVTVVCVNWRCLRLDGPEVSMSCLTMSCQNAAGSGGQVAAMAGLCESADACPGLARTHPSIAWTAFCRQYPEVIKSRPIQPKDTL
jgi:hypothetical protein